MIIGVTGASGRLGRATIEDLLSRGVRADQIVAIARNPHELTELSDRGIRVEYGDYDWRDTLTGALAGVDRLLLISSSDRQRRVRHHRNVIDAAVRNGVLSIAYTSIVRAQGNPTMLAEAHRSTEGMLRASPIPWTMLRHDWYWENYTAGLDAVITHGELLGAAGTGRVSGAAIADYAAAAATALTTDGHAGVIYELGGDYALSGHQIAESIAAAAQRPVAYRMLEPDAYAEALVESGLPRSVAAEAADNEIGIAAGWFEMRTGDLHRLIGRDTTPLSSVLRTALRRNGSRVSEAISRENDRGGLS
ncbi:SDR family oxidoreductase [Nocardia sp. NPDC058058]|uniref:SDR family oxidoreductase n=1 Tax=Nocardia sp. NPDC058058 TaxID=3346317 RepID=UPI0036D89CED